MKGFIQSLRRQDGFTLVELMVVVAIIGLLSAVAVPNFKQYQAKSKMTEAKLQLSSIYTAEQAFFSDYNIYAGCLHYMGYDPTKEKDTRYYAVGFFDGIKPINANAHATAVLSGLNGATFNGAAYLSGCPAAQSSFEDRTWFAAGKGVGSQIATNASDDVKGNPAAQAYSACEEANMGGPVNVAAPGSCVGSNEDIDTMVFQAAAVGIIHGDFTNIQYASGLNINHNKIIKVIVNGY